MGTCGDIGDDGERSRPPASLKQDIEADFKRPIRRNHCGRSPHSTSLYDIPDAGIYNGSEINY